MHNKDILFLLKAGFRDDDYGADRGLPAGLSYYCPSCATIEGVLAIAPTLADRIEVRRVDFPRPRTALIERIGEHNQALPKLILAPDAPPELATDQFGEVRFVSGHEAIMRVLSVRHGTPAPHF